MGTFPTPLRATTRDLWTEGLSTIRRTRKAAACSCNLLRFRADPGSCVESDESVVILCWRLIRRRLETARRKRNKRDKAFTFLPDNQRCREGLLSGAS